MQDNAEVAWLLAMTAISTLTGEPARSVPGSFLDSRPTHDLSDDVRNQNAVGKHVEQAIHSRHHAMDVLTITADQQETPASRRLFRTGRVCDSLRNLRGSTLGLTQHRITLNAIRTPGWRFCRCSPPAANDGIDVLGVHFPSTARTVLSLLSRLAINLVPRPPKLEHRKSPVARIAKSALDDSRSSSSDGDRS